MQKRVINPVSVNSLSLRLGSTEASTTTGFSLYERTEFFIKNKVYTLMLPSHSFLKWVRNNKYVQANTSIRIPGSTVSDNKRF